MSTKPTKDDELAGSEQPFVQHLMELRDRLLYCIYGIAVAEDTGKSIKGNKIDLYFDSVAECNTFGIRPCTVYFLG